jgi:hypothetical protein
MRAWLYMPIIPATQEAEVGRSQIWGQSEQFSETLSQNKNKAGKVVHACSLNYLGGRD